MPHRRAIYENIGGKFVKLKEPKDPSRSNFVIVCNHGDRSGFRTLAECEAQFPELLANGRVDGFYWVEERI